MLHDDAIHVYELFAITNAFVTVREVNNYTVNRRIGHLLTNAIHDANSI